MKKMICLFLCLVSANVLAEEKMYKDWFVNTDRADYLYAITLNNSGNIFGKYCYLDSGQCLYLTGIDTNCTTGNKYPVLVNADSGAFNTFLHCGEKIGEQSVLVFDNFDVIETAAKESKKIGIAVPMESGHFKVSRFSMSGSAYSINTLDKEAKKKVILSAPDSELL
ncbi:hypothetical protein [Vibrio rarus]|uniref:hypothetical protein n=1 Tax=Vibrio rarus TaxID=413403 RepID=UPI0021C32001|nr:hypothetical protein [Vibrio rarus]